MPTPEDNEYYNFKELAHTTNLGKLEYYQNIIKHRDAILLDVANYGQSAVATQLNIPQPKLSTIVNLLRAMD